MTEVIKAVDVWSIASKKWLEASENDTRCVICFKPLEADCLWVEIGVDGFVFGSTDEDESQGWFGIGPVCARKYGIASQKKGA